MKIPTRTLDGNRVTIDEEVGWWTVRFPRNVRFYINLVGYIRRDQIDLTLRIFR